MIRYSLGALALLLALAGCSQSTPVVAPATPPKAEAKKDGMKAFSEIVTEDAVSDEGLFTVHLEEDGQKLLLQVPDTLIGREILAVSRVAKTALGYAYGGTKTNTQVLRWDRQGNSLLLRTVSYATVAADSLPIYRAVTDSRFEPVVARMEIQTVGPDSASVVVDATDVFVGDTPIFGIPQGAKEQFKIRRLDASRSFLARANAYPENIEVRAVLTYDAAEPPSNSSTGTVSVEMAHSMILLPEQPMRPRREDPRVGYFAIGQTDYGLDEQRAVERRYITRWKLVPKDKEAYARGELVEPVEPIVYYIDPATPAKWAPYLKQGVDDWNVAFEAAGFKNAIRGEYAPTDDPDWSPEDARYSVIRYFASDVQNAYGPHVHDPRSGQILESDIGWYHNVMNLLRNWFFIQTAAVNPDARSPKFKDEVMGELVRFVSAHEVGHTLGLPHNWISSNAYPVDSLRSPTFTATHGTAPSIMDYARFNYIAQPGDGVTQLMPRVGEYDKWSIKWGYTYFPEAESEDEERRKLQAMLAEVRDDPTLRYGDPNTSRLDPRTQNEDLGDDNVYASQLGLANLKRIVPNLQTWGNEEGETYDTLEELYGNVVGQWGRYLGHVAGNVGGIQVDPKMTEEDGAVYAPIPADRQRDAVRFLLAEGFTRPDWLLDADIMRRIEPAGAADRVRNLQERTLDTVLDPYRLSRMMEYEWVDGAIEYSAADLLADLRSGLWSELQRGASIDASRRTLQRAHVDRLGEILHGEASSIPPQFLSRVLGYSPLSDDRSDVMPLVRGELETMQQAVRRAMPRYRGAGDRMERLHLQDVAARIEDILDPED